MSAPSPGHIDPVASSLHAAFFGEGFRPVVHSRRFRVMGTHASLTVVGGPDGLIDSLEGRLHGLEHAWSRFLPNSELSRLNHRSGEPVEVSDDMRELVATMVRGHRLTQGAFDPTLMPALVAEGYASSLVTPERTTVLPEGAALRGKPTEILVDQNTVVLPRGTTVDSGGVGKGLAADMVAREARERGVLGVLVDVGGDIAVWGESPRGDAWRVQIEDPHDATKGLSVIDLVNQGIATSTTVKRRFEVHGRLTHHLIDPRTLQSAVSDTVQASVVAENAAVAEMFTKVAFVHSHQALFRLANRERFEAACVLTSGEFVTTKGWPAAHA